MAPILEGSSPLVVAALDITKAYDMVSRPQMDAIMGHLGVAHNGFYRLMVAPRDDGYVYVTGDTGLAPPFRTMRGIK